MALSESSPGRRTRGHPGPGASPPPPGRREELPGRTQQPLTPAAGRGTEPRPVKTASQEPKHPAFVTRQTAVQGGAGELGRRTAALHGNPRERPEHVLRPQTPPRLYQSEDVVQEKLGLKQHSGALSHQGLANTGTTDSRPAREGRESYLGRKDGAFAHTEDRGFLPDQQVYTDKAFPARWLAHSLALGAFCTRPSRLSQPAGGLSGCPRAEGPTGAEIPAGATTVVSRPWERSPGRQGSASSPLGCRKGLRGALRWWEHLGKFNGAPPAVPKCAFYLCTSCSR